MKYRGFVIKADCFGSDYKNDYKNAYRRMFRDSVGSSMTLFVIVRFRTKWSCRKAHCRSRKLLICVDLCGLWTGCWGCPSRPEKGIKKRNPYGGKRKGCVPKWSHKGSNLGPADYESAALTN